MASGASGQSGSVDYSDMELVWAIRTRKPADADINQPDHSIRDASERFIPIG